MDIEDEDSSAPLRADVLVFASEELDSLPESQCKDALQEATRVLLRHTLQAQLQAIVEEVQFQGNNAAVVTACLTALGSILLSEYSTDADAIELLRDMGVIPLVQGIIRAHPHDTELQNAAQWILALVAGLSAIVNVVGDPQLGRSLEVVRSSFWALSSCREKQKMPGKDVRAGRMTYPQFSLTWNERRVLVQMAVQALNHWSSDKHILHHAITVLGASLCAHSADTPHDQAALVVPFIIQCMQTHGQERDRQLFQKAADALVTIIDGNVHAIAALQTCGIQIIVQGLEWFRDDLKVCVSLSSVLAYTHGLAGLIEIMQKLRGSEALQLACCWSINCVDCTASQILQLQAIDVLAQALETRQGKVASHPAAVLRALGSLVEVLISEPQTSSGDKVKLGLTAILAVAKYSDEVEVLENAFDALSNAACRSREVAAFIAEGCDIKQVVNTILGQPMWMEVGPLRSMFRTLGFLGGVAAICEVVEFQQPCAMTQQAALRAMVCTREGVDSCTSHNDAVRVVRLITTSLVALPNAPTGFHAAATLALGEFVGDLLGGDAADVQLWEKGFVACLHILKSYYSADNPGLTCQSIWAANEALEAFRRAQGNILMPREIMQREGAVGILVSILKDRHSLDEMILMQEVTLALGLLEGINAIRETMDAFPVSYGVQTAGCKAIGELYRLNYRFNSNDERDATRNSILRARHWFHADEHSELQGYVETSLGAITQIELTGEYGIACAPLHAREAG